MSTVVELEERLAFLTQAKDNEAALLNEQIAKLKDAKKRAGEMITKTLHERDELRKLLTNASDQLVKVSYAKSAVEMERDILQNKLNAAVQTVNGGNTTAWTMEAAARSAKDVLPVEVEPTRFCPPDLETATHTYDPGRHGVCNGCGAHLVAHGTAEPVRAVSADAAEIAALHAEHVGE